MTKCSTEHVWKEIVVNADLVEFNLNDKSDSASFSSGLIPQHEIRFHVTTKCSGFRLNLKRHYGLLSFYLTNPNGGKKKASK